MPIIQNTLDSSYSLMFVYGITVGIFFSASLYMVIFAVSQALRGRNNIVFQVFIYGALSFFAYAMFSIFCLPMHFPLIRQVIPEPVLLIAKLLSPLSIVFFIKMFTLAAPIKTLSAFLFWDRTKHLYLFLFAIQWIAVIGFIFIENTKTVAIIMFSLLMINSVLGIVFSSIALESKLLSKLYSAILWLAAFIISILILILLFIDLESLPPFIYVCVHTIFSIFILLFSFIIIRYAADETVRFKSIAKLEVEDFYRNVYNALHNEEFFIEYQPKLDLNTKKVSAVEALVRWEHPEKGRIPPDEFITAAEQTELIDHICKWVLKRVVKDIKKFQAMNLDLSVSVNFSVKNIHPNMVAFLTDLLESNNISSDALTVEVTESLFLDMSLKQKTAFNMLKDANIGISLDDFGAGFSSLRYLDEMKLSEIKLDKAFSLSLTENHKRLVVEAIIDLSHKLNICVVAEGVEDKRIEQSLAVMNCDLVQGYSICRPKGLDEFLSWYDKYMLSK